MLVAELSVVRASLVTIARSVSAFFTARAVRLAACSCSMLLFPRVFIYGKAVAYGPSSIRAYSSIYGV